MKSNLKEKEEKNKIKSVYSIDIQNNTNNIELKSNTVPQKSITQYKKLVKLLFILEKNDQKDFEADSELRQEAIASLNETKKNEAGTENVVLLGVIAKCKIKGCDVHALDKDLKIDRHYLENDQIDEIFFKARKMALSLPDSALGILVFSDRLEVLYADGTSEALTS